MGFDCNYPDHCISINIYEARYKTFRPKFRSMAKNVKKKKKGIKFGSAYSLNYSLQILIDLESPFLRNTRYS